MNLTYIPELSAGKADHFQLVAELLNQLVELRVVSGRAAESGHIEHQNRFGLQFAECDVRQTFVQIGHRIAENAVAVRRSVTFGEVLVGSELFWSQVMCSRISRQTQRHR